MNIERSLIYRDVLAKPSIKVLPVSQNVFFVVLSAHARIVVGTGKGCSVVFEEILSPLGDSVFDNLDFEQRISLLLLAHGHVSPTPIS